MNITNLVAKNTLYQFLSRLISSVSVFFITLTITRSLSKELWGDFVIVTSYLGIFTLISDFGLNAIYLKERTKSLEKETEFFQGLLGLRIVLSISSIFLALLILAFLPHSSSVKFGIIVGSVMILLQSLFNSATAVFQSRQKYSFFAISDVIGSLALIFLTIILVFLGANLFSIVLIFVIGNLVKTVVALVFVKKFIPLGVRFDFSFSKSMLLASLPIGLMLLFSQLNANIDKQIISLTSSENLGLNPAVAAGFYGLSYRIFDLVISISAFFANSLYPILLQNFKTDLKEFDKIAKKYIGGIFLIGVVVSIFGLVSAPMILSLFGDYKGSLESLRILILGVPIFYSTALVLWIVITLNKDKYLPFIYGFAALLNIFFNLILIPRFGFNSAAWVTVLTECVILFSLLILIITFKKKHAAEKI